MNQATQTPVTVEVTTVAAVAAAPAAPKAPSKKSQADVIFAQALADRAAGKFDSNKAFRAAVLTGITTTLGVSVASAATMYNTAKKAAETADAEVGLGRDPKKEKPAKAEGAKRGRPQGSKNRAKTEVTAEAAPAAEAPATTELVLPQAEAEAEVATAAEAQPEAVA
jgi:hypothetical protein